MTVPFRVQQTMTQGVLQGMACDLQVDTAVCPSGSRPYPIKIATQAPHLHPDMVTSGSKKKKKQDGHKSMGDVKVSFS